MCGAFETISRCFKARSAEKDSVSLAGITAGAFEDFKLIIDRTTIKKNNRIPWSFLLNKVENFKVEYSNKS